MIKSNLKNINSYKVNSYDVKKNTLPNNISNNLFDFVSKEILKKKEEELIVERSKMIDAARAEAKKVVMEIEKLQAKVDAYVEQQNNILKGEIGNDASKYRTWIYGTDYPGLDWCAVFVNWIFNHNGESKLYAMPFDNGTESGVAGEDIKNSIRKGYGEWYESEYTDSKTTPKAGDVVTFFKFPLDDQGNAIYDHEAPWGYDSQGNPKQWKHETPQGSDHVGYVYAVDDEKIYTIEGNANSYVADSATVDMFEYDRHSIRINGYYRPNYESAIK